MRDSVDIKIVKLPEGIVNWHLVQRFLELRKRVFVDDMHWSLPVHNDIEYEQYDTFDATYVIAHDGDRVLGGARLIRSDFEHPDELGSVRYSYMIRDAYLGLLPGIPNQICFKEPPREATCWELTRFVSFGNSRVGEDILRAANDFLRTSGAEHCLFLGPPAFLRMAKKLGFAPKPMGQVVSNEDSRFLAFSCSVA